MIKQHKTVIFYDGSCDRCIRDRHAFERWTDEVNDAYEWCDITDNDAQLMSWGIDPIKALTELHIKTPTGEILSELDAYIYLMRPIPRLRPLAACLALRWIRPIAAYLYRWQVRRRLRKTGRLPPPSA